MQCSTWSCKCTNRCKQCLRVFGDESEDNSGSDDSDSTYTSDETMTKQQPTTTKRKQKQNVLELLVEDEAPPNKVMWKVGKGAAKRQPYNEKELFKSSNAKKGTAKEKVKEKCFKTERTYKYVNTVILLFVPKWIISIFWNFDITILTDGFNNLQQFLNNEIQAASYYALLWLVHSRNLLGNEFFCVWNAVQMSRMSLVSTDTKLRWTILDIVARHNIRIYAYYMHGTAPAASLSCGRVVRIFYFFY